MTDPNSPSPFAPLVLTLAGLIPFAAPAIFLSITDDPIRGAQAGLALLSYAAVILSFLGGVRWGAALVTPDRADVFVLSVAGSLAGWALVLYGVLGALLPELYIVAAALLVAHWAWDAAASELPDWYKRLRSLAAGGAAALLALAWAAGRIF